MREIILEILKCKPVAYLPDIAKAVGSVKAGLFLSQLLYWSMKGQDPDGWVCKTTDEIYEETGLSRKEQETARKTLKRLGILEEQRRGTPARLYFRINTEKLMTLMRKYREVKHDAII